MSFSNKTPGRDFLSRSNSNPNKAQGYRNSSTNAQYNNGESYSYDEKCQNSSNSPKNMSEGHVMSQHNTSTREQYAYKNNPRPNQYRQNKNYTEKHVSYYSQRPNSPDDVIIPEIDHLREFVKEQTERFKIELSRHEGQKSSSPSPGGYQASDQNTNKYNKTYASRTGNSLPSSHSLGSISNNNISIVPVDTSALSPDNSNRHPDARMNQGTFATKNNNGYNNYNKHSSQGNAKPSPGLSRNLSHDETFSKAPIVNKNRNDSPNSNMDKPMNNKTQFPSPTGSSGSRQDPKKGNYRNKPFCYANGANPQMHQLNQNNSAPIEVRKVDAPPPQRTMSAVVRNGSATGKMLPPPVRKGGSVRVDGEQTEGPSYRAVVSVTESARHFSHSGSTGDGQDVDTPTVPEQFFTPDPPASPCSTRSSPEGGCPLARGPRHKATGNH